MMVISTGVYGNCDALHQLLEVQHEYSKFVTVREMCNLGTDDDVDYCMNILHCIPNIDVDEAKKAILDHVGYDEEAGWFNNKEPGEDWDYNTLDEVIMKYVGKDLYQE